MSNIISDTTPPFFIDTIYVLQDEASAATPEVETNTSTKVAPPSLDTIILLPNSINEEEKALLDKILQSISSGIGKHEIIKTDKTVGQTDLKGKTIISFGVSVEELSNPNTYTPTKTTTFTFLYCDELQAINTDTNKKLKLWNILKSMFSL